MPGPHPGEFLAGRVNYQEKQGHKLAGWFDILNELAVYVGNDLSRTARMKGSLSQGGSNCCHQQSGRDTVPRHIPNHHPQFLVLTADSVDKVKIVSAGFVTIF